MTDPNAGAVPPPPTQQPVQNIPNYLVQSILVTLFCCLPFGVAAIVFASQVNSKLQMGDVAGAMEASKKAKTFCWVALGLGIAGRHHDFPRSQADEIKG